MPPCWVRSFTHRSVSIGAKNVPESFSRGSSRPRDWTQVSCIAGRCFTIWATREAPRENLSYMKKKVGGGWGWGYIAPSSGWAGRPSSSSCYANIPTTSSASCSLFCCLVLRLYLTVCDTINCSPVRLPHQWVFPGKNTGLGFTSFSWGSSRPRCWTCISYIGRQTLYHWATDEALPPNPVQSQFPTLGIRKWSDWLHLLRVN